MSKIDMKAAAAFMSRTAMIRLAVEKDVEDSPPEKGYDELVKEASALRAEASVYESAGMRQQAASTYLLSAAKELEAASLLSTSSSPTDEARMKSALVMVTQLVKKGSGYKHLPDLPSSPMSGSVQ